MLDQVVVSGPVGFGVGDHLLHRVPLVIAREDARCGVRVELHALLVRCGDVDEPLKDLQPVVPLPDLFPQVRHAVRAGACGLVTRSSGNARAVRAGVERQELRVGAFQTRGDERVIGIDGEVDESSLGEEQLVRVAAAVLSDGVVGVLARVRVLQLDRRHGQAIDEQRHVDRLVGAHAVEDLARHRQHVGPVACEGVGGQGVAGAKVGEVDVHATVSYTLTQYIQHAACVDLGGHPLGELALRRFRVATIEVDQVVPALDLRRADEVVHLGGVEAEFGAEGAFRAFPAVGQELSFDAFLERPLGVRSRAHALTPSVSGSPRAIETSSCPVTAAVINAWRRSVRRSIRRPTS